MTQEDLVPLSRPDRPPSPSTRGDTPPVRAQDNRLILDAIELALRTAGLLLGVQLLYTGYGTSSGQSFGKPKIATFLPTQEKEGRT